VSLDYWLVFKSNLKLFFCLICEVFKNIFHILGPYLIVITKISKVGHIYGQSILRIEETEIIPFSRTTLHLTEEQVQYNTSYLNMIKTVLDSPYFYFSYTYDLTHTLQSLYNAGPDFMTKSLFERVSHLLKQKFSKYFVLLKWKTLILIIVFVFT